MLHFLGALQRQRILQSRASETKCCKHRCRLDVDLMKHLVIGLVHASIHAPEAAFLALGASATLATGSVGIILRWFPGGSGTGAVAVPTVR